MEVWFKISLMLCGFGILKEFRPSEPFVTKIFNNPPMNFTLEEIYTNIYPVGTYATVLLTILVFLITDLSRYKPIIILQGISGIITFLMIILCRNLTEAQVLEVFYGLFTACDVAYFTYIYANVDKAHYQEVTGHTRAAYLIGRAISGIFSQVLISSGYFSYYNLNFFTLGGLVLATLWALFLPPVKRSIYFHRKGENEVIAILSQVPECPRSRVENRFYKGLTILWADFIDAFTNLYVLKWAIWWALATCGYYQVLSYVQIIWEDVARESGTELNSNLNGAVEAAYTLIGAAASIGCGKIQLNWERIGEVVLSFFSILIGVILYVMSQSQTMWLAYTTYIVYAIIYHAMITIANSEVAKFVNPDSHGLIFGITTFMALVLQTILTAVVNSTLSLPGRVQFLVYATYFTVLGVLFALKSLYTFISHCCFFSENLSVTVT